jgi:hypothetical protein
MGYFDMASDPLSQAAERASLCLFLRGDLQTAPHSVALVMTDKDLARPTGKVPTLAPQWHWLAWVTRIGTLVVTNPAAAFAHTMYLPLAWQTPASAYSTNPVLGLNPYSLDNNIFLAALKDRGLLASDDVPNPSQKFFRSETGEITIDGPKDRLILDTPRTAGGYAPVGQSVNTQNGGVTFSVSGSDATVWVSALDQKAIRQSRRLLVTHLTDLQNTDIQYAEPARQALQAWGRLPYLVRTGKAEVRLHLDQPQQYQIWTLALSGKRLAQVPAAVNENLLTFTADVAGDPATGARLLYEITAD